VISAVLLVAAGFAAPVHVHEAGCSGVYLPEYDEIGGWVAQQEATAWPDNAPVANRADEPHLTNIRQLTFGGQNAEAYWSADGKSITYQTRQPMYPDEQIMTMNADGSGKTLKSTGLGRTTCSYFTPDGKYVYFSSTHAKDPGPQKPLDMSKGYLWMVNPNFSMYRAKVGKAGEVPKAWETVVQRDGYVAETTIAPNGKYMVWTGDFEGDIEIYRSDLNGKNVKRITTQEGYDGGPFISWDSKTIVYRRDTLATEKDFADYRELHAEHLIRPSKLEIWTMDANGDNKKQITHLGCASFAPFMHPDGKRIIFSSNYGDPKGREFNLFTIKTDGTDLQQITFSPEFDGFPMFTRDGKHIVFASNRNGKVRGETNIFVADWKD